MTNEEIIEEIWHAVYTHGIHEQVRDLIDEYKEEYPEISYTDRLTKAYYKCKPKK